jgi:hypothetical protein
MFIRVVVYLLRFYKFLKLLLGVRIADWSQGLVV